MVKIIFESKMLNIMIIHTCFRLYYFLLGTHFVNADIPIIQVMRNIGRYIQVLLLIHS